MFAPDDPYTGIDLDGCFDETGVLAGWAQDLVTRFDSYTELSPSGHGLHIIIRGKLPGRGRRKGSIEMYSEGRYFTVTGGLLEGAPLVIAERSEMLLAIYQELFVKEDGQRTDPQANFPHLDIERDEELINKARRGKYSVKFQKLWQGDISGYGSQSEADLALCNHIHFWTSGDPQRVDRLFRQSGLMRPKWDEQRGAQTYGQMTIAKVMESQSVPRWNTNGSGPTPTNQSEGSGYAGGNRKSAATLLVEIGEQSELWHTPNREPYATIEVDGHLENWRLTDKSFKRHLAHQYYLRAAKAPGGQAINDALQVLGGEAVFQGKEYPVYQRVGDHDGRIYLDLCDDAWQAIEVTATGWNPIATAPIKFRRPNGMLALPMPVTGGRFRESLEPVLNLASDDDWALLLAWEIGALNPQGPYPVLVLFGEQGSGKSTVARICRRVIDPNTADLTGDIRNTHDLMISAVNGRIIALDNVSRLQPWLSDALCCLATGAGFGTRELSSDDEEVLFSAMRPVILNGIAEPATRSDLVDRSIMLEWAALTNPIPERELMALVDRAAPIALGALLDLASGALARIGQTKIDHAPRMADFAQWVVASDPGGGFLNTYRQNRRDASKVVITSSWFATWLAEEAKYESGPMTPTTLYERLCTAASHRHDWRTTKEWPGNAKSMSDKIRRLAPNLRAAGVEVKFDKDHAGRTIELKPVTQA